jgi:hypothetical protein
LTGAAERTEARIAGLDAAGSLAYWSGDQEAARDLYEEQLALAQDVGDAAAQANAAYKFAHSAFIFQDVEAGQAACDLALEKYRELGDQLGIARLEWSLCVLELDTQSPQVTRSRLIELLHRFRDLGDLAYEGMVALGLAWAAISTGDVREASEWGLRGMLVERPLHDVASMTIELQEASAVLGELGDAQGAAVVLGAFGALSDVYGVQAPASFERFMGASDIFERIEAQLGPEQMADATRRDRTMTIEEVQTYRLERLDALGVEPAEA